MWKRNLAASVLSRSGASGMAADLRRRSGRQTLTVLAYHRILPALETVWDDGVVDATSVAFRSQMEFLRKRFTVISFQDLAECTDGNTGLPPNAAIVTFDDGYKDNYDVAYPILKDLGLPATIFLTTGHIGTAEPFWWDRTAFVIKHTKKSDVATPAGEVLPLGDSQSRLMAIDTVLKQLKAVPDGEKNSYLCELEVELDSPWNEGHTDRLLLTWDEVREMGQSVISFGGHTITHPVLTQVPLDSAREEIFGCKRKIEQETGVSPIAFAYPVGGAMRFDEDVKRLVKEAGFRFATTYMRGLNAWPLTDTHAIRRFAVNGPDSFDVFRAKITIPSIVRY